MKENLAEVVRQPSALLLVTQIINACADAKGKETVVLDVAKIFDLADYFIVVSGRSDRQVQGIANKVITTLAEHGMHPSSIEGLEEAQWVLLDYGDVILHVFYEQTREYYDIEGLWAQAPRLDIRKDHEHLSVARAAA